MKRLVLVILLVLPLALLAGPSPTPTVSAPPGALLRPAGPVALTPVTLATPDRLRTPSRAVQRTPKPTPRADRSRPTAYPRFSTHSSGLNWAALRRCESGGNYRINTGNGFYGAYQFDLRTWHGLGFSGRPDLASNATQDRAAAMLYSSRGRQPWPVCGRLL